MDGRICEKRVQKCLNKFYIFNYVNVYENIDELFF